MSVIILKILKELDVLKKHNKSGDQHRASKSIARLEKLFKVLREEIKN